VHSYLAEGPKQKMIVVDSVDGVQGAKPPQLATLKYKTLSQHGTNTLLEIHLETGRKNQIRVQMASLDCPIVGDRKYGADATYIRQIRLFAFLLLFKHPITKKAVLLLLPMSKTFLDVGREDEKY
jgi:23S rRNA pseudouridine1911/1915/1917 synthase